MFVIIFCKIFVVVVFDIVGILLCLVLDGEWIVLNILLFFLLMLFCLMLFRGEVFVIWVLVVIFMYVGELFGRFWVVFGCCLFFLESWWCKLEVVWDVCFCEIFFDFWMIGLLCNCLCLILEFLLFNVWSFVL